MMASDDTQLSFNERQALSALSALAHDARLRAFQLLVRSEATGLPAAQIAQLLGVPPTTMSTHLGIMCRSGLVASKRNGRTICYSLSVEGARGLMSYMTTQCYSGRADLGAESIVSSAVQPER